VETPDHLALASTRGTATGARRFLSRRTLWHTLGVLIALVLAWLIMRAYRQPDFVLEFANMLLC